MLLAHYRIGTQTPLASHEAAQESPQGFVLFLSFFRGALGTPARHLSHLLCVRALAHRLDPVRVYEPPKPTP